MSSGEVYVGIDLGTTNSAVAAFDGAQVTLVRNAEGGPLTPSVVRIGAKGQPTVGARARRYLDTDPENTKSEFKRLMGTGQPLVFPAARASRKPEELSAELLRALREDVRVQLGFAPERAVISVPALFELPQSGATAEAARLAGFERVELLQEPIASALAAGWSAADTAGVWLVYDYGGGTFDASLLETRDGLLRVVGHDGDNFLGGRDIDWAVVDWAVAELAKTGVRLSRSEPAHAAELRKLKLAAEEAKIELTRATSTSLSLPAPLLVDGESVEVDLVLERTTLEALAAPLVERTLQVSRRLLSAHGIRDGQLSRVVMVGGPTVMPMLRARVQAGLQAPLGGGHDPMTLVAEGAALYAATAGLDARPRSAAAPASARRLWLQYPAMSSDLTPHVIGRAAEGGAGKAPATVRLVRAGEPWESPPLKLDGEGAFVATVSLLPRRPNLFRVVAAAADGAPVVVEPASFTIVQGLTLGDPPLSRTVGVALADDTVRRYFERGAPLPARRTFVHRTVDTVAKGAAESVLEIPIVQGELARAHLCRRVGSLSISGGALQRTIPAGTEVELTLELDRGGRLSARARVAGQVFEEVAHLLVPEATPEALAASLAALRTRAQALRSAALRSGRTAALRLFEDSEASMARAEQEIAAARGGDGDAAQKAKRTLLELDHTLEAAESEGRWPELDEEAKRRQISAAGWVASHGTPTERRLLEEAQAGVERAREARDPVELERQLRLVDDLASTAFQRDPEAWRLMFERAACRVDEARDLPAAERLVQEGRRAVAEEDAAALKGITQRLWRLLPPDAEERAASWGSGVR